MTSVLLNFSGHRLSDAARAMIRERYSTVEDIPLHEMNFQEDVEQQLRDLLATVRTPLDGSVLVTIIPPGHATFALLLEIFLNGVLGYYPSVCLMEPRTAGGYLPTNVFHIESHKVRRAGRLFRQAMWSSTEDKPADSPA